MSVELLILFGASTVENVVTVGRLALTPVDLAMIKGHLEIVDILETIVQNPDLKLKIAIWRKVMKLERYSYSGFGPWLASTRVAPYRFTIVSSI